MDAKQYLTEFYNKIDEDKRLENRAGSVEFLTTMRYIEKYLKQNDRILEIGAGTGRYSHTFAKQGYTVDAVELIEHNIEIFKENSSPEEKITITQGNAVDLSLFEDNAYDITLILGPMYHLFTEEDKKKALSEAIRVTKTGGLIFAAYCISDSSILEHGFMRGYIFELIERGLLNTETFEAFSNPSDLFELHRKEDIDKLMSDFSVTRLHYVSADGYSLHRGMNETISEMTDEMFALYLKYHFAVCERPDMVGLTNHALDVFRKN